MNEQLQNLIKRKKNPLQSDIETFRQLGREGLIDFTEFLEDGVDWAFIEVMVEEDWCIEEMATSSNYRHKVTLIYYDKCKEYYEGWKNTDPRLHSYLAEKGYFYDEFINSENLYEQEKAFLSHPEYMQYALNDPKLFLAANNYLYRKVNPDYETLTAHILVNSPQIEENFKLRNYGRLSSYKTKLQSMETEPTTMDKTMTVAQLYHSGNPLWAKNVTVEFIDYITYLEENGGMEEIQSELNEVQK